MCLQTQSPLAGHISSVMYHQPPFIDRTPIYRQPQLPFSDHNPTMYRQAQTTLPPFPDNITPAKLLTIDYCLLLLGDIKEQQKLLLASSTQGFFYLKNHDLSPSFLFDLSTRIFSLPLEEKLKYDMGRTTGKFFGYRKAGIQVVDDKGTPDTSQAYNISKDDLFHLTSPPMKHPEPVYDEYRNVKIFMEKSHVIVLTILAALGVSLGLEPEVLPNLHRFERTGGDQVRLTWAPPCEDQSKISLRAHSDLGSVSVLFNQLGGLQVLNPDSKEWRYVKPIEGFAVVNLGSALSKLLGGRVHDGRHRVVTAPGDQGRYPRRSVVYFSRPNGDVKLRSMIEGDGEEESAFTADEWIKQNVICLHTGNNRGEAILKKSIGVGHPPPTA